MSKTNYKMHTDQCVEFHMGKIMLCPGCSSTYYQYLHAILEPLAVQDRAAILAILQGAIAVGYAAFIAS